MTVRRSLPMPSLRTGAPTSPGPLSAPAAGADPCMRGIPRPNFKTYLCPASIKRRKDIER